MGVLNEATYRGSACGAQTVGNAPVVWPARGERPLSCGRSFPDLQRREAPLASLSASPLAGRFCAWRGASDQRYVASVYAADRAADDAGLPHFDSYILISVARGSLGRRILHVTAIERAGDRRTALALGLACGTDEWHVHFLANDPRARAAMVADLRARHCGDAAEARCA